MHPYNTPFCLKLKTPEGSQYQSPCHTEKEARKHLKRIQEFIVYKRGTIEEDEGTSFKFITGSGTPGRWSIVTNKE